MTPKIAKLKMTIRNHTTIFLIAYAAFLYNVCRSIRIPFFLFSSLGRPKNCPYFCSFHPIL